MRTVLSTLLIAALCGCTGLLLGGGGPYDPDAEARSPEQITEDNAATAAVMSRLAADPVVAPFDIDVATYAGRVTLSGTVGNREARSRAHEIAASVDGVISVRNGIRVAAQDTR